jgi:CrcB protein
MGARRIYRFCGNFKCLEGFIAAMNSSWAYILVFLGGGAGSMARFLLSQLFHRANSAFHWGTFSANMVGCFLIGLLIPLLSKPAQSPLVLLTVAGFCGGFTTFSTFSWESLKLLEKHGFGPYLLYVGLTVLAGVALTFGGYRIALQVLRA